MHPASDVIRSTAIAVEPVSPLILAVVLTVTTLLALWGLIDRAWWLTLQVLHPLFERNRDALQREQILRLHELREQMRRQQRRQGGGPRLQRRIVDLDGQQRWLDPEELRAFHRRCWAELGLAAETPWPQVRQQWRRRAIAWHPDQGGDPADWLRKQRAYEALRTAASAIPPWRRDPALSIARLAAAPARSWFRRRR